MSRSDGSSANAVELAEHFARLYLEADLIKVTLHFRQPPKVYGAARDL
jgi:hypothetical protein